MTRFMARVQWEDHTMKKAVAGKQTGNSKTRFGHVM